MIKNLDNKERVFILKHNYIGQLAYMFQKEPYVIPITYFYSEDENVIICYSGEGHKLTAMRKNNSVSLNVTEIESVNDWRSVLVHGVFEELEGSNSKAYLHQFSLGVKDLILKKEHRDLDFISEFSSKIYNDELPTVFLIKIKEVTGKMRKL